MAETEPSLLKEEVRAIYAKFVLADGGKLLDVSKPMAVYDSYELSFPTRSINFFLSHSWKTVAWLKYFGLRVVLYFWPSVLLGAAVSLLMTVLEFSEVLPLPIVSVVFPFGEGTLGFSMGFGWWLGVVVFVLVFFNGERFFGNTSCFLDRACIHQEDIVLKARGVAALHDMLVQSDKMVIMWQREYFTRLWCVFELAIYMKYKGTENIILLPLNHCIFTLFMMALHIIAAMGFGVMGPFVMFSPWLNDIVMDKFPTVAGHICASFSVSWVVFFVLYMISAPFVFHFFAMSIDDRRTLEKQIAEFTTNACECMDENDRPIVYKMIEHYFGTVSNFDAIVQKDMKKITSSILGANIMRYRTMLVMEFGHMLLTPELFVRARTTDPAMNLHVICGFLSMIFVTDMLAMSAIQFVVRLMHDSRNSFILATKWWLGPVVLSMIFATFTTSSLMILHPESPLKCVMPVCAVGLLLTYYIYRPQTLEEGGVSTPLDTPPKTESSLDTKLIRRINAVL
ncbi:unnamed protein product [Polarella glacialis]|uniref:Uncharacterized protein n=1 Tax=Polarella glacialis TaxID=89957 RepID=A0A813EK15_POLGL|nr:unnamed protein product [Polarella glacialis]